MIAILTKDRSMIALAQNCEVIHICESVRLKTLPWRSRESLVMKTEISTLPLDVSLSLSPSKYLRTPIDDSSTKWSRFASEAFTN